MSLQKPIHSPTPPSFGYGLPRSSQSQERPSGSVVHADQGSTSLTAPLCSLPTQPACPQGLEHPIRAPPSQNLEFTSTDNDDAESTRQYVTENIPLPTSCVQPRPRFLVSATYHSPQHARQAIQLIKSIADNHEGMHVRFNIRFSQQQLNHIWTVDTPGQNALIYASSALLLLLLLLTQTTAQLLYT